MEEKYKIHAGYILFFLILVIIALLTVRWSEIPNLSGYLTFALTVSSLVLSVVAIFYTIYSNASFAGKLSDLNNASQSISAAAISLSQASNEIREKVEGIPAALRDVGSTVQQTHLLVKTFSEAGSGTPKRTAGPVEAKAVLADATAFLQTTSINGLLALYACSLSFQKKIPFDLAKFCGQLKYLTEDYAYGFLVGFWGRGMTFVHDKGIINALTFEGDLARTVKVELDRRLEREAANPETKAWLEGNIAAAESYFHGPIPPKAGEGD